MTWMEGAARRLALRNVSRRRRIVIAVVVCLALLGAQELIIRATGGRDGPWAVLVVGVGLATVHLVGRVMDGMVSGRYAGRPLDLPRARLIRDAARHYPEVSSWTSPLRPADALARLTERMQVPPVDTRAYDGALWIRLSQRRRSPSPDDPTQDVVVTEGAEVMVFIDDAGRADLAPGDVRSRSVITVHHRRLHPVITDTAVGDERRREAAMTEHLVVAVQDATGG